MSNFSENLSRLLKEKGISQFKLASDLNLAAPSVSRYCTGLQLPRADIVAEIAKYLNISTDELLGVDENVSKDFYEDARSKLYQSLIKEYLSIPKNFIVALLEELDEEEHKQVIDYIIYLLSKHEKYQNIPNTKDTP